VVDRATIIHEWCLSQTPPSEAEFFATFVDQSSLYILEEGPTWDFKKEWPFSYSDSYFGGIARLICAFANTWGGVIVFGVHDERRTGGSNKVLINLDKLKQAFQQLTGSSPDVETKRYSKTENDGVVALFVRPRPVTSRPLRFLTPVSSYPAQAIWMRSGHEVVQVAPTNYPVLFCRAGNPLDEASPQDVQGSLPPSPSTLKRFVGRLEVIDKLFVWLHSSDEPRTFLFGKGGSGKTSIAYEFAKLIRNSGAEIPVYGGRMVDTVIFLSAKEKALVVASSQIEEISDPDFTDELSLHRKILLYGRWMLDEAEIENLSPAELKAEIKNFFDVSTCLLIVDDVDTLTTKGIDAGFDFLYKVLSRTDSGSKILYTLRNAPSHSLLNSIEVPGLAIGGDYETFVSACAAQFGVQEPKPDFRGGPLASLSERRPLVIESIIALVRTAGSYKRAAELFQQHAGADVREYVFVREWDALPPDGLTRLLLIALSEIGRSANFKDLETVLQAEATQVQDAIGAVREMFLQIEGTGDEASYSLAQLTKQFVNTQKMSVARYDILKARIKSFKRYVHTASPQVAHITLQVERLLPPRSSEHLKENAQTAWSIVNDSTLPASITEEPIFQSVKGYVASCMVPSRITDAREAFSYAGKMGYDPEYQYLKAWFAAEKANGQLEGGMDVVADTVIKGKRYTQLEKAFMAGKKAAALYFRGRERFYTDTVDAERDLQEALRLHLFVYKINIDEGHHWSSSTFEFAKNTAFSLFNVPFQTPTPWDVIEVMINCMKQDGMYADPLQTPITETLTKIVSVSTRPDLAHKYKNKLKPLEGVVIHDAKWTDVAARVRVLESLRATESALVNRTKLAR
jgi:Putative DNA-binding domain